MNFNLCLFQLLFACVYIGKSRIELWVSYKVNSLNLNTIYIKLQDHPDFREKIQRQTMNSYLHDYKLLSSSVSHVFFHINALNGWTNLLLLHHFRQTVGICLVLPVRQSSDDCQMSHQTSVNSHQTSVRQVPHIPDIHHISVRYMVYVWCICGTCLTDVWWELTDVWWGV